MIAALVFINVVTLAAYSPISPLGQHVRADSSQFCVNSTTRGCYELDVGPLNMAKLPLEARAKDTFIVNPTAGPNQWAACEKTNAETVAETEIVTDYCVDNAVEKVKTCHKGSSKIMLYYYTGECREIGTSICNSMFTVPSECLSSTSDAMAMASAINSQMFETAQQFPVSWEYGYCMQYGDAQVYAKQEVRNIGSGVQLVSDYWWVYSLDEQCVEGNPAEADFRSQGRSGDIVASDRLLSDRMGEVFDMEWRYYLNLRGCSDFPWVLFRGDSLGFEYCYSGDADFCGCSNKLPYCTYA